MAGGEPHNSRAPQPRGDCIPTWGGQDGAVAVCLGLRSTSVGRCLGDSQVAPGWIRGEWVQVYNPYRVKSIHIAAYSVMYISYTSVTLFRVVNPDFYLPLVQFPLWSQMRCREREFLHRPGMGERHDYGLGLTGAGMARVGE